MKTSDNVGLPGRVVLSVAYGLAILAGLKYGYDFGAEISGKLLGVVLAINGAIFCSIIVSMVADWALRALDAHNATRRPR